MHLVIATATPRPGVTEDALLEASRRFQEEFVRHQDGIVSRTLAKAADGRWTDVVLFRDAEAIEQVMAAEQDSAECAALMSLLDLAGEPDVLEVVQTLD